MTTVIPAGSAANAPAPAPTQAMLFGVPLSTIIYTFVAFLVGYGGVASATGYRYSLVWDWNATVAGLIATGIYHAPTKAN